MADTLALFDLDVPPAPTAQPPDRPAESRGVRRTKRQAALLQQGVHPLTLSLGWTLRLHDEAAPADDRQAGGRRCGNCRFRRSVFGRVRGFPKCVHPGSQSAVAYETLGPLRATHGTASDIRAWWCGCVDHEPGDSRLPDAMRWVPNPGEMR